MVPERTRPRHGTTPGDSHPPGTAVPDHSEIKGNKDLT